MTNLTTDPPFTRFDNFEALIEYKFKTYSRKVNLAENSMVYNLGYLGQELNGPGRIEAHEAFPKVSHLWKRINGLIRPVRFSTESLYTLRNEISNQTWRYINNSAMLPDYGVPGSDNISTMFIHHMQKCNKSAIIDTEEHVIMADKVLKAMGKKSYVGVDKMLEAFLGYRFRRYFPSSVILKVRYLFGSGITNWWRKHFEYSLNMKYNIHIKNINNDRKTKYYDAKDKKQRCSNHSQSNSWSWFSHGFLILSFGGK